MKHSKKRSKWTQVDNTAPSQGLPEHDGPYLAITSFGAWIVAFPPVGSNFIHQWKDRNDVTYTVAWWRPLPKGPKE